MKNYIVIAFFTLICGVENKSVSKSGLQIEVTKEVKCKSSHKAQNGDKVTVHYGGFLQDGKLKNVIKFAFLSSHCLIV